MGVWSRMMFVLLGAALAVAAGAAPAPWYEARTDHFRVFVQGTADYAGDYATKLERFDRAMRVVRDMPEREGDRANPLIVYVVPNVGTVQRLCRGGQRKTRTCDNVFGFFTPQLGQSVAYTPRSTGPNDKFSLGAQAVLFHEYAHHFMYGNAAGAYPSWFSEGFAEFNATTEFAKDGTVMVGRVPLYRGYSLLAGTQIPLRLLLTANGNDLKPEYRESLYARGWLLTHYLTFDKARSGQLTRYLALMSEGKPSLQAAETAFGDLKTLASDLDRYLVSRNLSYIPLKPGAVVAAAPRLRQLGPGEVAMLPVSWQSDHGVDRTEAQAVVTEARRIAAGYSADGHVQDALAEAEYDAGNDDPAEAAADRALAADPGDRTAMMYKGRARLRRATTAKRGDTPAWREARAWFVKANRAEPNDAEPLALFYQSFLAAGLKPTANAVDGIRRAFDLSPQSEELHYLLARDYLLGGDLPNARAVLVPLAFDPHGGADSAAAKLVALIDAKDTAAIRTLLTASAAGNGDTDGR